MDPRLEIERLQRQIDALTTKQPPGQRDEIAKAYARADSVAKQFGNSASGPVTGETPIAYRRRLLQPFMKHSNRFKDARLDAFDAVTLHAVEDMVYQDAIAAARSPSSYAPGTLTPITTREGGRDVTRFVGDPMSWMGTFMQGKATGSFDRPPADYRK